MPELTVLVHGGVGGTRRIHAMRGKDLERAAKTGASQSDVLDAVEAAVSVLEASPNDSHVPAHLETQQ